MSGTGVAWLGSVLLLVLITAALGAEGLIHAREPRSRYLRLLVFAAVLLAITAALAVNAFGCR